MRTVGIIVEYNPLHNGHVYHIQQSRKVTGAEAVVAVMSGHFLQRGEPALLDKWSRADMALHQGVDLLIELPVAYSVQPAEWFAYGAVSLLEATGIVDTLCFGSEIGNLAALSAAAERLSDESDEFQASLRHHLKHGMNYPAAFAAAASCSTASPLSHVENADDALLEQGTALETSDPSWIAEPNNSLGLHYLMALHRIRSSIAPYTIARQKAGYHDQDVNDSFIASATAIRKLIMEDHSPASYMPASSWNILQQAQDMGRAPVSWKQLERHLFYQLQRSSRQQLAELLEVTEGLEYRMEQALPQLAELTTEAFIAHIKSKRYTRTKLQRMLTHILLGHRKVHFGPEALAQGPAYIRVLGFNEKGQALLKRMRKTASCPIVHKVTRDNAQLGGICGLTADVQATAIYANAFSNWTGKLAYRDYYEPPIRR